MLSVKKAARMLRRDGAPDIKVRNPDRYLHAHARRRTANVTRNLGDTLRSTLSLTDAVRAYGLWKDRGA